MPQTGVFRDRWWRQAIRAYQTGRTRTNPKDQVSPTTADLGIAVGVARVGLAVAITTASPGITVALAPVSPPSDVAATVLDYSTLGPVNGASGGSMSGHLLYAVNTGRWWFFTYGTVLASGTATGGTTQTLVDSGAAFTTALNGRTVVIVAGTGAGNAFEVTRTSATTLRLQNNGDPATPATLTFTPGATSQYVVVDSRKVRAYVSSSNDLSTATWAAATGSASADMTNGVGVDMAGGRFDGGAFGGIYPTDGRQLAMTYANVAGHDIAYAIAQVGVHWFKISNRARITAASTIAWDNNTSNTNPWDDGFGAEEALPYATQPFALQFDTNNSRWHVVWNKTQGLAASAWTSSDNGTLTQSPTWGGYVQTDTFDSTTDNNSTHFPWQVGLVELASGIMLAVYGFGNAPGGTFSTTVATQTGLRFTKSSSATAWPTTTTGAAVPSLSSTANSPNDWSMVARTTTDVHVIRRNSATVIEQIRYDGTSWSSVTTLPTTGLTGHVANSGVGLATDGTTVWCVVLDSDASNSIKSLTWTSAGGWASSWTTLATNGNAKSFLSVHSAVGNSQVGVAWTEGPDGSGRYSVRAAGIPSVVTQTGTATLGIQAALAPAGLALAQASSTPGVQAALAPAGIGVTTGTATPGIQAALAPTGLDLAQASSIPGITAALAPAGIGVAPATAAPGIAAALASAALGIAPATSAPAIVAALAPSGLDIAPATSTPGVQVGLAPSSTATAIATSTPGVQAALAPSALAVGVATATPGVAVGLAPLAGGASASATPGITAALAPSALAVALATAAPAVTVALAPQSFAQTTATSTPGVTVALLGSAGGLQIATSAPGVTVALVGAALVVAPVQAAPGLVVALVSVAFVVGQAQATPGVRVALAAQTSGPAVIATRAVASDAAYSAAVGSDTAYVGAVGSDSEV